MTKKKYYTWQDVESAAHTIVTQMYADNWSPDYIVGITRGGLPLAVMISNLTGIPMYSLDVSFRDKEMGPESNLWMPEDAFGIVNENDSTTGCRWDSTKRQQILIVDDINDSGKTFNWIKEDWQSSCFPSEESVWNIIWMNNVRFATMTDNSSSDFGEVMYFWNTVNKAEEDVWLVYPWEQQALLRGGFV